MRTAIRWGGLLLGLGMVPGCGAPSPQPLSQVEALALVAAEDRSPEDREVDARRDPVAFLLFSQVARGARVADLGAGGGYTTELLARAVGPEGTVYGHNTPYVIEKYVSESWPARLAKPVNARVVRVDREWEDPLPPEARDLDLITLVFVYHDTPLANVDRAKMNANLFAALRPGGTLVLIDHHARAGAPVRETAESLHRIDEAVVKQELAAAGFELEATGDFMAHPGDPRDAPFFKMDQPTDAFVHRWRKPQTPPS